MTAFCGVCDGAAGPLWHHCDCGTRNSATMRPSQYSTAALSDLFHRQTVAALPEVMAALGTRARRTAFRKLKELPYRTSYSHRGRLLHPSGTHQLRPARAVVVPRRAVLGRRHPAGHRRSAGQRCASRTFSARSWTTWLHVGTQDVLRKLVQERKLSRQKLAGQVLVLCRRPDPQGAATERPARPAGRSRGWSDRCPDANLIPDQLRAAIVLFASLLDERQRRLYAGLESLKCGWGGDARIAGLLGIDPGTVARGRKQLLAQDVERVRVRRPGGGRPPLEKKRPR